jgi:hypothetical protein
VTCESYMPGAPIKIWRGGKWVDDLYSVPGQKPEIVWYMKVRRHGPRAYQYKTWREAMDSASRLIK